MTGPEQERHVERIVAEAYVAVRGQEYDLVPEEAVRLALADQARRDERLVQEAYDRGRREAYKPVREPADTSRIEEAGYGD